MKILLSIVVLLTTGASFGVAQRGNQPTRATVCGNPRQACKTTVPFQPYDLPFRVPKNAVISETELFYAIIMKSVGMSDQDCDIFVPESERLEAQSLFPGHKVFTSRCQDIETMAYTNVSQNNRFMAVYAGHSSSEAQRMLAAVKATGKYPGASIRRMRTGFNGT
jgi:hypothetical protein